MFLVQLIILQVVIFGVLIFALRSILSKNITHATSHLDELNTEFIRREEEVKKREEEAAKSYETSVAKAKEDIDKLHLEAARQVQEEHDRIISAAQAESEQLISKAEKTKEMMVNELRKDVEAGIMARIQQMMVRVLPEHAQKELHRIWIEDLLSGNLEGLRQMRVPAGVHEVKLKGAFALTEKQKTLFEKKFKDVFGRDFRFIEETDPALVAGVLIVVGDLVLDGTLANKIEQVVHEPA